MDQRGGLNECVLILQQIPPCILFFSAEALMEDRQKVRCPAARSSVAGAQNGPLPVSGFNARPSHIVHTMAIKRIITL